MSNSPWITLKAKRAFPNGNGQYRVNYYDGSSGKIYIAKRQDGSMLPINENTPMQLFNGLKQKIHENVFAKELSFYILKTIFYGQKKNSNYR
jgi:hypothetical protein